MVLEFFRTHHCLSEQRVSVHVTCVLHGVQTLSSSTQRAPCLTCRYIGHSCSSHDKDKAQSADVISIRSR